MPVEWQTPHYYQAEHLKLSLELTVTCVFKTLPPVSEGRSEVKPVITLRKSVTQKIENNRTHQLLGVFNAHASNMYNHLVHSVEAH